MCDDDKKEFVLRDCNKRWREFKTRLTREYLTPHEKNEEEHPPWKFYPGIDEDDWKLFKELREKPEFKAISEQNRSNQAKNEHPHHLGRGGYEKQEERKIKAQLKNVALSSTPSSSEFEMPAIPPKLRYEKWIEGRKEKNGNIPNEKTKEIVEKIYELRQKEKSGDFVSSGSHDILTESLGTPENGGYVRGVGGKTTLTSIFKRKKRGREINGVLTFKQVEEFTHLLTEQVREKTRAEMKVVTLELLKSCGIHVPNDVEVNMNGPTSLHPRSSCHSIDPDPFVNGSKEPIPCELLVLGKDQVYRVVARGTLCKAEPGEIIHNVPLLEDHVKVTILDIVDGEENTPLPLPFFGHEYLGDDVKGSWAQWPRKQVDYLRRSTKSTEKEQEKYPRW